MTDQPSGPIDQRTHASTEVERNTYVREWIARRIRSGGRAATGLVGAVLTLPMLASAQGTEGFVEAALVEGVSSVQPMPDGSVQLGMSNGTTISVPASEVATAANGAVLVSPRIVEIAAEVMAAAAGGGAVSGALIGGLAGAGALAAAAGGGGGDDGPDPLPAINSQVLGASGGLSSGNTGIDLPEGTTSVEVTLTDEDGNETTRTGQIDENGEWTVPFTPEEIPQGRVTVTVTSRDSDDEELESTSQDVLIDTVAPTIAITNPGAGPDDTLNIAEQAAGITVTGTTDAEDGQVVTVTIGVTGPEFTATANAGQWSVDIPASALAGLDDGADSPLTVTAEVADAAGNLTVTSDSIALDFTAPTISIDPVSGDDEIGLVDVQGPLTVTGTTNAAIGQPVILALDGQDFTGSVISNSLGGAEPNAWSVTIPQSALEALQTQAEAGDGTLTGVPLSATVSDEAGNPAATPASTTIDADFNGPSIAIDPVLTGNGDSVLNTAERDAGFEISGTTGNVADGSPVTVAVNGTTLAGPVAVDANGDWSVTVGSGEAGTFPANGTIDITASATDGTTGLASPTVTQVLDVDLAPPTIAITDNGLGDDTLNIAEQSSGITVTGTTDAEDGQTVTVQLYDGVTFVTATGPANGGNWSVDIRPADLAAYSGTGPLTITADVDDAAGNPAPTASQNVATDLDAPVIAIDPISGDNEIGLADTQGDLEITGTTDAEVGQTVTVSVNNILTNGQVTAPGVWSATLPQADVLALQTAAGADGILNGIQVNADVSDAAGNPAQTATTTIDADFNGPSITIDTIAGDNIVNADESGQDIIFSGTVDNVPDTQDVTLNVGSSTFTVGISGGAWQTSLTPAEAASAGIVDGATVTVTADVSDADGVAAQTAQQTLLADFTAPVAFLDTVAEDPNPGDDITDDLLNAEAIANGMVLSGRATGAPGGTVELFFGAGDSTPTTAPVDANGDWSQGFTGNVVDGLFPAGAGDRVQDFIVVAVDEAGNRSAPVTRTVTLDVTAPTVTIDPLPLGGDSVLNIAESGSTLTLSGTVTGGGGVTITLDGTELSGVTVTGTNWTVDVPPATLQGLPAGQTIDITAEAADAAGNVGQASTSFDTDFTAPSITITDTGVGPDDVINIAERDAGITVSGEATGAEGRTVTVTLSGVAGTPIVGTDTVTGGTYAVDFSADDLGNFGGWAAATVTAEVSDAAGNPATPAADSFDIDLVAPSIAFDDLPSDPIELGIEDRDDPSINFTTSETAGADVTLTFTRADGTVDLSLTEAIEDIPETGGVFDFPVTPAQFAAVQDLSDYTVALSITDAAGNTGDADISVSTDFAPGLTIDEIGEDGAVDISDTADASITGTTFGVEQGRLVTVTVTGATSGVALTDSVAVAVDGTWDLSVAPSVFDNFTPGETFTVDATVTNAAGRTATDDQAGIDAYLPAVYAVANTEEAGTTLGMTAFAAEGLDAVAGIEAVMSFDPGLASYVTGSDTNEFDGLFIANATNAAAGTVSFNGGNLTAQIPEGEVIFGFDMEDQGAGPITLSFVDGNQGGPTELQIGTSGADTLTASNTDSVIQGKGGDDQIDVSATGTNIVVFELGAGVNGTDTITGFTTGTSFQADQIAGLGADDLRGNGEEIDTLGAGGTLGADAGFVIFTTALADTGASTIETALEGLTGENAGDVFYAMAGDGTDAALVRATVNGADDISLERLADFNGIGDLGNLSEDNIILSGIAQVT